jgi:enoyl-CoA hydratase/carnithine racemase
MIRHCGKPVIARVNGITAGGGFEFVAASDLAIASENARFISPGPRVGMTSIGGLSQWLPLHMSIKKATEIVMLSRDVKAQEALKLGIVNKVVPMEKLDDSVKEDIDIMLNLSPASLHYFKVHINFWKDFIWDLTWEHAKEWFSLHIGSIEPSEGLWAFKEKREREYQKVRELIAKGIDPQFPFGPLLSECKKCGTKYLPQDSKYCLKCGEKIKE